MAWPAACRMVGFRLRLGLGLSLSGNWTLDGHNSLRCPENACSKIIISASQAGRQGNRIGRSIEQRPA